VFWSQTSDSAGLERVKIKNVKPACQKCIAGKNIRFSMAGMCHDPKSKDPHCSNGSLSKCQMRHGLKNAAVNKSDSAWLECLVVQKRLAEHVWNMLCKKKSEWVVIKNRQI
jgi:hypothetical protein